MKELSKDRIECDLVGVDASIANAIRRVLLSDVPTIAIEKVFMLLNTSIVQDEVLAQRLGLVPLAIRPDLIEPKLDCKLRRVQEYHQGCPQRLFPDVA